LAASTTIRATGRVPASSVAVTETTPSSTVHSDVASATADAATWFRGMGTIRVRALPRTSLLSFGGLEESREPERTHASYAF